MCNNAFIKIEQWIFEPLELMNRCEHIYKPNLKISKRFIKISNCRQCLKWMIETYRVGKYALYHVAFSWKPFNFGRFDSICEYVLLSDGILSCLRFLKIVVVHLHMDVWNRCIKMTNMGPLYLKVCYRAARKIEADWYIHLKMLNKGNSMSFQWNEWSFLLS